MQKAPSSHAVPSGWVGWVQLPPEHTSAVHVLPSSVHDPVRFVKTQPLTGSQVSVVHSLPSLQTRGPPGWQVPDPSQLSPIVQALLSLQEVPAPAGV